MRYRRILVWSAAGVTVAAALILAPLWHPKHIARPIEAPTALVQLRQALADGEIAFGQARDVVPLIPVEEVSVERTPCFGPCPVYVATFHRDGHATLTRKPMGEEQRAFVGSISQRDFIRLAEMVLAAREAAGADEEYLARWTDDYTTVVRAHGRDWTWRVADYGRVAPAPVYGLELFLDALYEHTQWAPAPATLH